MRPNWFLWRSNGAVALAVVLAAGCGASPGGDEYFIRWVFVNNSGANATFIGTNRADGSHVSRSVPQCGADSVLSNGFLNTASLALDVTVSPGAQTTSVTVTPDIGGNARVTAVWDGTGLTLAPSSAPMAGRPAGIATPFEPSASPPASSPSPALARTPFEPGAAACQAPVKWRLDGITGNAAINFQNQVWTLGGTLTLAVPQEVQEGQAYPVSATFSGTMTANPGWEGSQMGIGVSIVDAATGLAVQNTKDLGRATPTASGSLTLTGSWVIPANQSSLPIRTIRATGSFTHAGPLAQLVATYSKAP